MEVSDILCVKRKNKHKEKVRKLKTILAAINAKYIHTNLAIRYIRACSPEYGFDIFEATINENPLQAAWAILDRKPDLLGFSCYIWNIDFTLKLCSMLKAARPSMIIVLGGPEADFDWQSLMEKHEYIDFILRGEGEFSFRKLYEALTFGKHELSDIEGLCYREGSKLKDNPKDNPVNLDDVVFPYGDYDDIDKNRIYYYESSRGCPFNCKYCLSSTIKGVRQRSLDKVKKELMWFIERDVPLVKFIDRTFNSSRHFSMEIWRFLIENARNTRFHFEIEADLLDDAALGLLSKAPKDLFQFEIGVQTTNKDVLKNINRLMDFQRLSSNIIEIVDNNNIQCHLDLIAGLPGEDMESFRRSFDDCIKIMPHMLQLGFLKVLKGSPMMDCVEEYGLKFMPCAPYQILSTKDMSLEDMRQLVKLEQILEDFYNSGIFQLSMNLIMGMSKSQFDLFTGLSNFAEGRGYFSRRFDLKDKFYLLHEFVSSQIPDGQLKELLRMDYLIATKKTYLPEFLHIQMPDIWKEKLSEIKKDMKDVDFRFTVFMPVSRRIKRQGRNVFLEKWDGFCSIDVRNGNVEYYK